MFCCKLYLTESAVEILTTKELAGVYADLQKIVKTREVGNHIDILD